MFASLLRRIAGSGSSSAGSTSPEDTKSSTSAQQAKTAADSTSKPTTSSIGPSSSNVNGSIVNGRSGESARNDQHTSSSAVQGGQPVAKAMPTPGSSKLRPVVTIPLPPKRARFLDEPDRVQSMSPAMRASTSQSSVASTSSNLRQVSMPSHPSVPSPSSSFLHVSVPTTASKPKRHREPDSQSDDELDGLQQAPSRTFHSTFKVPVSPARSASSTPRQVRPVGRSTALNDLSGSAKPRPRPKARVPSPYEGSPELPEYVPTLAKKNATPANGLSLLKGKGKARADGDDEKPAERKSARKVPLEAAFKSLDELGDFPPGVAPSYALWVLVRCAILGDLLDRLTLDGIISRIGERYPYYHEIAFRSGSESRAAFIKRLKTAITSRKCFVMEKDSKGEPWYSVDEKVNPVEMRSGKNLGRPMKGDTSARINGSTASSSKENLPLPAQATTSKPPQQPPVAAAPKYVIVAPPKLPPAALDIHAHSLQELVRPMPLHPALKHTAHQLLPAAPIAAEAGKRAPSNLKEITDSLEALIPYDLAVVIRAAILGSPYRKLRLDALAGDLTWKYPQLAPAGDAEAKKRLKTVVSSLLNRHACFFVVRPSRSTKGNMWMVDMDVDPLQKKDKAWQKIPPPQKAADLEMQAAEVRLAALSNLPPSAQLNVSAEEDLKLGIVDGKTLATVESDLLALATFYTTRAEKWNRRLAYIHMSEVSVLRQPPPDQQPAPGPVLQPVQATAAAATESPKKPEAMAKKRKFDSVSNSPELSEPTQRPVKLAKTSSATLSTAGNATIDLSSSSETESAEDKPVIMRQQLPPAYICGFQDLRTNTMCETRLQSREERETHIRYVHGVRNAHHHVQKRFVQDAERNLRKQEEQARIDKKLQGKQIKKAFQPDIAEKASLSKSKASAGAIAPRQARPTKQNAAGRNESPEL